MKAKILVYSMKLRTGKHVGLLEPPALDHSSTFTPATALQRYSFAWEAHTPKYSKDTYLLYKFLENKYNKW